MPDPSITVEEGCTLIEALSAIHPEAKKNSLRRMISQGRTRIDGVRGEHPRQRVGSGSTIVVLSRLDGTTPPSHLPAYPSQRSSTRTRR